MMTHIYLDRRFQPLEPDTENDPENFRRNFPYGLDSNLAWDDLLRKSRVVVLAEPGTGKTEEFKATTNRLRQEGKAAFFCRIEILQASEFDESFDIGTETEFHKWREEDSVGYFLLDSVDEARLQNRQAFEAALRRFSKALGPSLNRAKLIVSCRVSNWRATADREMFLRCLPIPEISTSVDTTAAVESPSSSHAKGTAGDPKPVRKEKKDHIIFQLMPLNKHQIEYFAAQKGVQDTQKFITAVEHADSMIFAERPQDLLELIGSWNSEGRLGKHSEMLEFNIRVKLVEHDPERGQQRPLSDDAARSGAERLAAASTLQKRNAIILPDRPVDIDLRNASIDPQRVLPEWRPDDILTLLDRAIFDEAVYGTIQFHHRSVREYLMAKWLIRLLEKGAARRCVEGLLFAEPYGCQVVIPSMRPIAGWMALWDERIRARLKDVSPEVLLENGDPASLPIEFRRALLISFAERYAGHRHTGISVDLTMIRRLADPELSSTINDLLKKYADHDDLRTLLLELIWQGQLSRCADIAFGFAIDSKLRPAVRAIAIRAVAAAGTPEHRVRLVDSLCTDVSKLDQLLVSEICDAFFPSVISTEQLVKILETVEPPNQLSYPYLDGTLEAIIERPLLGESAEELLRGLHDLLSRPPLFEHFDCPLSQRHAWLLPIAIKLANRFIQKKEPLSFAPITLDLFLSFLAGRDYLDLLGSQRDDMLQYAKNWPEFRFRLFWHAVTVARSKEKDPARQPTSWQQVKWDIRGFWAPTENDLEPLFQILSTAAINDRLIALTAIFAIYTATGRPKQLRDRMRSAAGKIPELKAGLNDLLHPSVPQEVKKWQREERGFKRREEERERKQQEERRSWQEQLKKISGEIVKVGNPQEASVKRRTAYLYERMKERSDRGDSQLGLSSWRSLIDEFGYDVAKNFRDGCVAYWRGHDPLAYPNRRTDNSIPWPRIIGLTGLAMEAADDRRWVSLLSAEEALNAARFSVCELNGLPFWFDQLLEAFPELIDQVIEGELKWEMHESPAEAHLLRILSAIRYSGSQAAKDRYKGYLLGLLEEKAPDNALALNNSLEVILEGNLDQSLTERFTRLARRRFERSSDSGRKNTWLIALLSINGKLGTKLLKRWIAEIPTEETKKQTMIGLFAALSDFRDVRFARSARDYEKIEVLEDLLPMIYQYIRVDEDRHHEGTYTPDQRDDAEQTRARLAGIVYNTPGRSSYDLLIALSDAADSTFLRDRMTHLAKERAALDAEFEPWDDYQIAEFAALAERQPRNERELFQLALARLDDLKIDIEDGDESEAALLLKLSEETQVRTVFANRLRKSSHSQYTIGSEEELADATRSDIRLNSPQVSAPVPIELKIADKWSYAQLCERLENQLIGQYMRVSQWGIFLVVHNGRKRSWSNPKESQPLTFSELVVALIKVSHELAGKYANVSELGVIGIDFTARNVRTQFLNDQ